MRSTIALPFAVSLLGVAAASPGLAESPWSRIARETWQLADARGTTPQLDAARPVQVAVVPPPPAPGQPPIWRYWGGADYMYMWREGGNRLLSFFDSSVNGCPCDAIHSREIDPEHHGFRVFGGFTWDMRNAIEASYMHLIQSRRDKTAVNGEQEELQPTFFPNSSGAFDNDDYREAAAHAAIYRSSLHSAEVNFKHRPGVYWGVRTTLLGGFRFVYLRETLIFATFDDHHFAPTNPDDAEQAGYSIRTRNLMFGGQIGANLNAPLAFIAPFLSVEATVKFAALANFARQKSYFDNDHGRDVVTGSRSKTAFATVTEGSLRAAIEVNPNVVVFVGYNVMYVTGVATAPRQYGDFNRLKTNASLLYHGPTAGVKVLF
jgi:hypothetical protein